MTTIIRTYENYTIVWDRGSSWSGYRTWDEAQATLEYAFDGQTGHIEAHQWEVEVREEVAHIYQNTHVAERKVA